ncbi:MAG: DUF2723 domain-containing protein [Chloroflexi bacterium]|nr:DUF2723 domain-containing protein [Chloroflexota bacterium]
MRTSASRSSLPADVATGWVTESAGHPLLRARFLAPAVAFLVFIVYLRTLAPSITWENGGIDAADFAAAAATWGTPHPTGYPLFSLLGSLIALLPVGEVAYRLNLLSALLGAIAVGCLVLLGERLVLTLWPAASAGATSAATIGALAFAFTPLYWSQATVGEVYTLHVLLVVLGWHLLLGWYADPAATWRLPALAGVAGLAAANHLTSLVLLPMALAVVLLTDRGVLTRPYLILGAAGVFLLGLLPYLYLPVARVLGASYFWGDATTLPGFVALMTGATYQSALSDRSAAASEHVMYFPRMGALLVRQFGWTGILLVGIGLALLWRSARPLGVAVLVFCVPIVLFTRNYWVRDSRVYLLPVFMVGALLLTVGGYWLVRAAATALRRWLGNSHDPATTGNVTRLLVGALAVLLVVWFPVATLARSFPEVDLSQERQLYNLATGMLDGLPAEAILVADSEAYDFAFAYLQNAEQRRPDVIVIAPKMLVLPWYRERLQRRSSGLAMPPDRGDQQLRSFLEANARRPLFVLERDRPRPISLQNTSDPAFRLDRN